MATRTPYLDRFTTNLNEHIAHESQYINHAVGREHEVNVTIQTLIHAKKNNPFFTGEAGVGKTDLVYQLANLIVNHQVPTTLRPYQIHVLKSLGELDTNENGELGYFNHNFANLIDECVANNDHIILFIDEFHTLMNDTGSQYLKPPLANGTIHIIGATTFDEFHDYVEPDRAMQRRFDVIPLDEPTPQTSIKILKQNLGRFMQHYQAYGDISITDKMLHYIVQFSIRFLTDRFLPDKAFDILDATLSDCVDKHDKKVSFWNVCNAVYAKTNIPAGTIASSLSPDVFSLEDRLRHVIKGQDEPIDQITKAVDIAFTGLNDPTKPLANFLFLGTTGVGKTETVKMMARVLYQSEDNMIRVDMGEYNTADAVDRLIGTGRKRGTLTEAVRRRPYGILLLDEIEKANPHVWDLLLSVIDDGEIKDGRGRYVNFKNLIIVMTSNLATGTVINKSDWIPPKAPHNANWEERQTKGHTFMNAVNLVLRQTFRPEFINRIDNKVVFNVLDKRQVIKISKKYMDILAQRLRRKGFYLLYDYKTIDYLTDLGTNVQDGARPLKRTLKQYIIGRLSENILKARHDKNNPLNNMNTITITVTGHKPTNSEKDLWGDRQFKFGAQVEKPTQEQRDAQEAIFNDDSIDKMVANAVDEGTIERSIAASMKNKHNN